MFEYHGWLNVLPGPTGRGEDEAALSLGAQIVERATELDRGSDLIDVRWVNGYLLVHFGGVRNRRSELAERIVRYFRWVGQVAPGSYGLLHFRDDDDPRDDDPGDDDPGEEFSDQVRVLVMTRGSVAEHADPFLSPVVPTLEDEVEPGEI